MEDIVEVRATFAGLNIKGGKAVMQFELDGQYKGELPRLAVMTGKPVTLGLSCDQQVLFVDEPEEPDGQAEAFPEEDEPEELDAYPEPEPEYEPPELPAPSYDYGDYGDEAA